ncbi:hypothetical protein GmHk_10G028659 [Glycine max]|nr:hypothetical protein GmHk_10G028659 [Glycine max]
MASRTETSSPWRSSRAPRGFSPSRANGSRNLTILVADLLTNAMTTFRHRARMVSSSPSQITSPGWMNYANSVSPSFTVRSNAVLDLILVLCISGSSQSQSWYSPSVRPSSHVPPSKVVAVIAILKDKSVDEL